MPADPIVNHLVRRVGELEERVARLEEGLAAPSPPPQPEEADPLAPSPYVRELVASGNTVTAIHEYRKQTGLGLKEAKRRIEGMTP